MSHVMNTYGRLPVAFSHGEGPYLFDTEGKRYLDALAGIAVSTLGHNHPDLVKALADQAGRVLHTSNLYRIPAQEALADRLAGLSQMDEVFFSNSGCEANEAAIKLARYYGHKRSVAQPAIVVMEQAFHGRTLATLSATGNRKVQAGFEPLVPGFIRVPFDNIAAVEQVAKANSDVVAVMLEPIQGEGGIRVAHPEYLKALRALCDAHQWLLMVDEVQCGFGRTGKWFAHQWSGIKPDVMTLAKGLGSGVPVGACLTAGRATGVFGPGNHGSTFGGNPLACTAGLTTIDVMLRDGLLDNAAARGVQLREGLAAALAGVAGVVDIRGDGLMVGVELDRPCAELVGQALAAGLLINVTAERVIRLLPPLTFTDADVTALIDALAPLVRQFLSA
ncbi:MAG TPA: aspartate aminotransferase family protein [Denitromonas sp.]|uniref:aspartate aminotransferase family protein n=1 Tax=Denitromonas sp. TaxID=2734609 RepID=UPI001D7B6DF9|nr:aspartate aminotransferase family protein [Rhodocyclaceae bacterium]MCP5220914.1 aspartate aminotransferase family protein [Zoogloeaceae bacterium]HQU87194.1 aspartate aminotransferase family protein [Denitromonas sp.]HQV13541.1 aspartate aminotransferase family protein [Denitromonas sp.]